MDDGQGSGGADFLISMTNSRTTRVVVLATMGLGFVATALALRRSSSGSRIPEAILILIVALPVVARPQLIRLFAMLDLGRRLLILGLFGLVFVGLVAGTRMFPFVAWNMYAAAPTGPLNIHELDGVRASGDVVPLVPGRLLHGITANRLMARLNVQIAELLARPDGHSLSALRQEHDAAVAALARLYNESHPDDPIETVIIFSRAMSIGSNGIAGDAGRRALWRVEVE